MGQKIQIKHCALSGKAVNMINAGAIPLTLIIIGLLSDAAGRYDFAFRTN